MREEQIVKLQARAEQLVDVFLVESDPSTWSGAGIPLANMDKETRGNAYWCAKKSVATLAVAQRIMGLIQYARDAEVRNPALPPAEGEPADSESDDLDRSVAAAEKDAARLIDAAMKRRPGVKP